MWICGESSVSDHKIICFQSFLLFDGWVSWEKAIWWLEQSIWAQSSHLGRYRDPPSPPSKGVGSVEGEECGQIWAKFGPYIELWVNIPSLCGSHLGKMDPQASPNYAWQAAGGGSKCESFIKPRLVFHPYCIYAHWLQLQSPGSQNRPHQNCLVTSANRTLSGISSLCTRVWVSFYSNFFYCDLASASFWLPRAWILNWVGWQLKANQPQFHNCNPAQVCASR